MVVRYQQQVGRDSPSIIVAFHIMSIIYLRISGEIMRDGGGKR